MRTKVTFFSFYMALLSAAILLTIYLAWAAFPLGISWKDIPFPKATVLKNYNVLLDYLTSPFTTYLDMPDFATSPSGRHHFVAVKYLFHLAQAVFLVSWIGAWDFWRQVVRKGYGSLFRKPVIWFMALPLIIAVLVAMIGFDRFFVLFHQILFVGDSTWLFDPAKDPVILILPEDFFMRCFVLFFFLYEGLLMAAYVLLGKEK